MEFYQSVEAITFVLRVVPNLMLSVESTMCPKFSFEHFGQRYLVFTYNDNVTVVGIGGRIKWPGFIHVDNENTFKLEFEKKVAQNWTIPVIFGDPEVTGQFSPKERFNAKIQNKIFLSDKLCLVSLLVLEKNFYYIGPGRYIYIIPSQKDISKRHPFYPMPVMPFKSFENDTVLELNKNNGERELDSMLHILVDARKPGTLADRLCQMGKGELVRTLPPSGKFCITKLRNMAKIYVLAYEFGVVPAMSVIIDFLQRTHDRTIMLLHINPSDEGIIMAKELSIIAKHDKRFTVEYLIADLTPIHDNKWIGNFTIETLETFVDMESAVSNGFFLICGRNTFVFETSKILKSRGCKPKQLAKLLS